MSSFRATQANMMHRLFEVEIVTWSQVSGRRCDTRSSDNLSTSVERQRALNCPEVVVP